MIDEFFFRQGQWAIFLEIAVFAVAVEEVAFWWSRRHAFSLDPAIQGQVKSIQSTALGLMSLLLGFSFSMSEARYETRRLLGVQETIAIHTVYLRTQLTPEPQRGKLQRLLQEYVERRLDIFRAGANLERAVEAKKASEELHKALWAQTISAVRTDPHSESLSLFTQGMNDMIGLHARRVAALRNRVPETILFLFVMIVGISMTLVGYTGGMNKGRNVVAIALLAILSSAVITVIIDLDRTARGLIVSQPKGFLELQETLRETGR